MLLYLYSMGEQAILIALIFDFRQRKTLVLQLLQFMFIVFPITMGLTILPFLSDLSKLHLWRFDGISRLHPNAVFIQNNLSEIIERTKEKR